jgi:hypothetical protein
MKKQQTEETHGSFQVLSQKITKSSSFQNWMFFNTEVFFEKNQN